MTIPAIKDFIDGHGLKFIGFDLDDDCRSKSSARMFAANGWSMSDLDKWHAIEIQISLILSPACISSGCRITDDAQLTAA